MSAYEAAVGSAPVAVEAPIRHRPKLAETWWRHVVGVVASLVALFPVWFVASAAFNADQSVSGTSYLPTTPTLHNFGRLLHNATRDQAGRATIDAPFLRWLLNSVVLALATAVCTAVISALAAYAFSRFRFRGRRFGMLALLLIQMFPALLMVVSIYLIVLNVGAIVPVVQLNSLSTVMIVYLGGAMGVNTWLMKGFLDSIPKELDESARVDGATPGQIFWGVILPLALPILAVVALWSFISTFNEYVIASAILNTTHNFTLPLGMYQFISSEYGQRWGYFAAGSLLATVPAVIFFMWAQRYIVSGLSQGAVKG